MEAIRSREEERLLTLLQTHGAADKDVAPAAAWAAFKAYGREVAARPGVGLLFQVGTYSFTGEPLFYFDPVAQFEVVGHDGEHEGFEQVHCELSRPSSPELDGLEANLWSYDFPSVDAFYKAVEDMPALQAAIRQPTYRLSVIHEAV